MNGVVPVSMKIVWSKHQRLHIDVRDFDSERIRPRVELRFHRETCRPPHVANELMLVNDSPAASIKITCARRASSARILRLRTRRSSSVRSSSVNVSAIWRWSILLVIQR